MTHPNDIQAAKSQASGAHAPESHAPAALAHQGRLASRIRKAGLRPTRQRLALAHILFAGPDRHITAERLHAEALASRIQVSLATVYNTLRQFEAAGLLREVAIEPGRLWFDTNVGPHHHFFHEGTGELSDIPEGAISLNAVPPVPPGSRITRVDVIVRLADEA